MMDSVALLNYDGDIGGTLEAGIGLIGGLGALKSPLIIKPNICTSVDNTGFSTTSVKLVKALINTVLEQDSETSIKIVESDSESKYAVEAFDKFGYTKLEKQYRKLGFDVSLVNLSRSPTITLKLNGHYFRNPRIPEILTRRRYFVSLAVCKTHALTLITGSLKNLFGLVPRKDQSHYHRHINEVVVDLNRIVQPDLCIVDARVGLEGWNGPRMIRLNTFILGMKPVSVDSTMAKMMGFKPERIRHLVEAEKYNLGSLNPKVLGESVERIMVKFKKPSYLSSKALISL